MKTLEAAQMSNQLHMSSSPEREPIRVPGLDVLIAEGCQPRNRPWTERDEGVLREYYGRVPAAALARELGRTPSAVQNKANGMGLSAKHRGGEHAERDAG